MRIILALIAGTAVLWTTAAANAAEPGPLKAGAATSNITPPLGTIIVGVF